MLARIKRIARSRYLNYQSMIKQWLAERLERKRKTKFRASSTRVSKKSSPTEPS